MNLQEQRMFNDRPHPNPLLRGEGTGCERFENFGRSSGKSSRKLSRETANGSPSPGEDGRGEGERFH